MNIFGYNTSGTVDLSGIQTQINEIKETISDIEGEDISGIESQITDLKTDIDENVFKITNIQSELDIIKIDEIKVTKITLEQSYPTIIGNWSPSNVKIFDRENIDITSSATITYNQLGFNVLEIVFSNEVFVSKLEVGSSQDQVLDSLIVKLYNPSFFEIPSSDYIIQKLPFRDNGNKKIEIIFSKNLKEVVLNNNLEINKLQPIFGELKFNVLTAGQLIILSLNTIYKGLDRFDNSKKYDFYSPYSRGIIYQDGTSIKIIKDCVLKISFSLNFKLTHISGGSAFSPDTTLSVGVQRNNLVIDNNLVASSLPGNNNHSQLSHSYIIKASEYDYFTILFKSSSLCDLHIFELDFTVQSIDGL